MDQVENTVYWYTLREPEPQPLAGDTSADVVIVGGGMAGLMCAQTLLEAGKSVVVLERDFCGAGASGKTSGFITPDSEIELSSLLRTYGPERARTIWEFVISGLSAIRHTIQGEHITCDYESQDSLFIANSVHAAKYPWEEHEARMRLGYRSTFYKSEELHSVIGSRGYAAAVRYPDTFGMNSYLYCQGLRDVLLRRGARIHEQTPVHTVDVRGVTTARGRVRASSIVLCADRFLPELGAFPREVYHVQTFLAITKPLTRELVGRIFPTSRMMIWDTDLVYNYFRVTGDHRVLIGGGNVLYTYAREYARETARFARRLARYMQQKFPDVPLELEYLWPGMLGVSKDLLPVMGEHPAGKSIWCLGAATGLPWAAALGRYAAERLLHGRDDFDTLFSPNRRFVLGRRTQAVIGTPMTYAISHGVAKYF